MKKTHLKNKSGIYALACPESGRVRYVGRSVNIYSRYCGHTSSKSKLPVSQWCQSLKNKGLMPNLILVDLCDKPEEVEEKWIAHYRSQGLADLNLHNGGAGSSFGGAGRCAECWSVEGVANPLALLTRSLWKFQRTNGAKSVSAYWKGIWAACKTELDRVAVLMNVFHAAQNLGNEKIVSELEEWAIKAAPQINAKYPGRVTLVYNDGIEETP